MPDLLAAIEHKYAFPLPPLYRQLYHDGMLDWFLDGGYPNSQWSTAIYPRLRQKPPILLYAQDFELYSPETVLTTDIADDWDPLYQFVPLGQTGGGDLYAFCPSLTTATGDTPVTLSLHDDNKTTVLAPSLAGFIFREMLDRATSVDEYALADYPNFEALRLDWQRAAQSISPYLPAAWNAVLAEVYTRPLQAQTIVLPRYQYTVDALLPTAEFEQIIGREIGFDQLNATFEHWPE